MQIEIVDCHRSTGVEFNSFKYRRQKQNININNITHNYTIQMNQYSGGVTSSLASHFVFFFFFSFFFWCQVSQFILNHVQSAALFCSRCFKSVHKRGSGEGVHAFGQAHESLSTVHCHFVTTFELFLRSLSHHFAYKKNQLFLSAIHKMPL